MNSFTREFLLQLSYKKTRAKNVKQLEEVRSETPTYQSFINGVREHCIFFFLVRLGQNDSPPDKITLNGMA